MNDAFDYTNSLKVRIGTIPTLKEISDKIIHDFNYILYFYILLTIAFPLVQVVLN